MQRLDFNTGWHFSCPDGRDFDVTLPHDAMLNTPRNTEPGFTWFLLAGWRGNDYTYTKNLHITSELINKHLVLEFEGVYCMTTVTVNDRPAAEKAYGYTPFTVELDGLLREGDNTIEVTAHVPQDGHNRWYTGGGIYRPVHLLVGEDAYMERYGVRVTTLSVAPACVRVEVMTHGGDCAEVRIAEKNGKEVVCAKAAVADGHAVVELEIPNAKLWNAEHPNLYLAEVTLYSGGKAVDTVTESFGLRVIEIDPARGLLINGEPTFLRGGCIHNDMGVIGVINNDATELHRARNIKKAGFNAIRSAHHPMSRSLMKACDEVGLYVMDEAFDYWYRMKSPNSPYNRYFMAYTLSKRAMNYYTSLKAVELGKRGIRVNALLPGSTDTGMKKEFEKMAGGQDNLVKENGGAGRLATPQEMADPLLFLNSGMAVFVSGLLLIADMGHNCEKTLGFCKNQLDVPAALKLYNTKFFQNKLKTNQ